VALQTRRTVPVHRRLSLVNRGGTSGPQIALRKVLLRGCWQTFE